MKKPARAVFDVMIEDTEYSRRVMKLSIDDMQSDQYYLRSCSAKKKNKVAVETCFMISEGSCHVRASDPDINMNTYPGQRVFRNMNPVSMLTFCFEI